MLTKLDSLYCFPNDVAQRHIFMLTNTQTNKQTPLKTSNALRYTMTLGRRSSVANRCVIMWLAISTRY